jgi:alanine-glyoxylate transaminase/serine-glyoxylate transaminase/serine-pyruvate transaminase
MLGHGRDLLAIPGPSVMPDSVLRAMHRAAPNIYEGELVDITASVIRDLKAVARTAHDLAIYIGNGHAAWEAALANTVAPGDRLLVLATGRFGLGWAEMARALGADTDILDFGTTAPADPARVEARLRADTGGRIKAVLTVQTDTSTSVINDVAAIRAAIDAAAHPALYMVDCIASLGCDRFEMDAWGVDVMVSACQKGLMTPPGLGYVWFNDRADAARADLARVSPYWDWRPRARPAMYYQHFCGTAPTHHLFGQRVALDMIAAEGLENVWTRHRILSSAVHAAVAAWGAAGALACNIPDPAHRSASVTTIRTAPGDANRLRHWCQSECGLTLGIGLGLAMDRGDGSDIFRIGHMGHLNPPMLLGTLATIDAGLTALGIAHGPGATEAATRAIGAGIAGTAVGTVDRPQRRASF